MIEKHSKGDAKLFRTQKQHHNKLPKATLAIEGNHADEAGDSNESETDTNQEIVRKHSNRFKKNPIASGDGENETPTTSASSNSNKPTKPTKASLKPTTELETTNQMAGTKFSRNSTGTPSMKPTEESQSTPLPAYYEAEFSGSGDGNATMKDKSEKNSKVRAATPTTRPTDAGVTRITTVSKQHVVASGYEPTKRHSSGQAIIGVEDEEEDPEEGIYTRQKLTGKLVGAAKARIKKIKQPEDGPEDEAKDGPEDGPKEGPEDGPEDEDIMEENKTGADKRTEDETEKRILCIGDSITEGYYMGGEAFHPYSKKLTELLNAENNTNTYNVYNEGVSGECVYQEMTGRMPLILQKYKPLDLVIILGGTNDLNQMNCSERNLFEHIKQLHDMAHEAGAKTVAITVPDSNVASMPIRKTREAIWKALNEKIRAYAEKRDDVILCDLAAELPYRALNEDERLEYWDDNLHYTPRGYDRMAEIIYDSIQGEF